MLLDLDEINVAEYEFSGEELGELLLSSIKQIKAGQCTERQISKSEIANSILTPFLEAIF